MECKTTSSQIFLNEVLFEGAIEQPVDIDFTLPDYCPDIGKILTCRVNPAITSRAVSGDKLTLEGKAGLEVLYLDGYDGKIFSCDYEVPFTSTAALPGVPDSAKASLTLKSGYINCRAISQRKVDIHGAFNIAVSITAPQMNDVISDASGAGVYVKQISKNVGSFVGHPQAPLTISEALELSPGKPPIAAVIRSDTVFSVNEAKAIANKLLVKGEALLHLVYRTDSGDRLETMEYALPFNQLFDLTGVDDTCLSDVSLEPVSVDISLRTDADGEYRRLVADVKAFADIKAYRPMDVVIVSDAYSVDCELAVERKQLVLSRLLGTASERAASQSVVSFGEAAISRVDDIWAKVNELSAGVSGGVLRVIGKLQTGVIATDTEGSCAYYESTRDVDLEFTAPDDIKSGSATARAQVRGVSFSLVGENKLEASAELEISAAIYDDVAISTVSGLTPDESKPRNKAGGPAVTLYFADAGEELWDIAREHVSSVESIKEINELSDDVLPQSARLLITQ